MSFRIAILLSVLPTLPAAVPARGQENPDRDRRVERRAGWLDRRAREVAENLGEEERRVFEELLSEAGNRLKKIERVVALEENILNLRDLRAHSGELRAGEFDSRRESLIRRIDSTLEPMDPQARHRLIASLAPALQEAGYPVWERFPSPDHLPLAQPSPDHRPPDQSAAQRRRLPRPPARTGPRAAASIRAAQAALGAGDWRKAETESAAAVNDEPANIQARLLLAMALALLDRREEALFEVNTAARIAPPDSHISATRAFVLNRGARHREAKSAVDEAIRLEEQNAWAWFQSAYAQSGLGDREGSLRSLERAAVLQPRGFKALREAAQRATDTALLAQAFVKEPGVADAPIVRQRPRGPLGPVLFLLGVVATPFIVLYRKRKQIAAWVVRQGLGEAGAPMPAPPSPGSGPPIPTGQQVTPSGSAGRIPTGYRLIRQIGAGGMGAVYEAEDVSLERRVAIKRMRDEIRQDSREFERFLMEVRTVAKLQHPNVIEIYAIVERDGELFLVFEYIDGSTLEQSLARRGRLSVGQAMPVLRQVCAALAYAHERGVIHRDLKPSNIMLASDDRVKVMDFGIARQAKDALNRLSMTNTVAGTPPYMAPESETGVVRVESDLYSLAVCLYEVVTGMRPFDGTGAGMLMAKLAMRFEPPSRRAEGLPAALDAFFQAALHADPEKRPRTAAEFAAAFSAAAGL